jgi:aminoglycoside phosphotransferase family enzyme
MNGGADSAADLARKVAFLLRPDSHAGPPAAVEHTETHMSHVFLAAADVYKLKKPLANTYQDLRPLAAREANCRTEVTLNRRLAPDVYFGVVPLLQHDDGTLALSGAGTTVDWLVHMRRLPADRMLDRLIVEGRLNEADVDAVGRRLARFFAEQAPVEIDVDGYVGQLREQLGFSLRLLADARFDLPREQLAGIERTLVAYLDDGAELAARVRARRIVEGHGDLRPEHVCLLDPPVVIDCLEFYRPLRLVDPFEEIAFLGLECARLGAPWVGARLQACIVERLDDHPPPRLVPFHTAVRACIRARLAAAHLLEPQPRTPARWVPLARDYLARAEAACRTLR